MLLLVVQWQTLLYFKFLIFNVEYGCRILMLLFLTLNYVKKNVFQILSSNFDKFGHNEIIDWMRCVQNLEYARADYLLVVSLISNAEH